VIGRPYIDVATGLPSVTRISAPGLAAGTIAVGASASLQGAKADLFRDVFVSGNFKFAALGGFRFL
jgi:hypothetical protein